MRGKKPVSRLVQEGFTVLYNNLSWEQIDTKTKSAYLEFNVGFLEAYGSLTELQPDIIAYIKSGCTLPKPEAKNKAQICFLLAAQANPSELLKKISSAS